MAYNTISFDRDGQVATITMNLPGVNVLTPALMTELAEAVRVCETDRDIRAVVLTATGRAFCAGASIDELAGASGDTGSRLLYRMASELHERIVEPICRMPKPVLAGINAAVAGAGMGLALCCDLRIAASQAHFTLAYSAIGVTPDGSTSFFLPRLVGTAKAMELYFTNERVSAEQALELGLVNRVVPAEELAATVHDMAKQLAAGPSFAYGQAKRLFARTFANDLPMQLNDEARAIGLCAETDDCREGLAAFRAKRPANFVGQ